MASFKAWISASSSKQEEELNAFKDFLDKEKIHVKDVASFGYLICSREKAYSPYSSKFSALARKTDGKIVVESEALRKLSERSPTFRVIDSVVAQFHEMDMQELSPIGVFHEMYQRGVGIIQYPGERVVNGEKVRNSYTLTHKVGEFVGVMKFGYPETTQELIDYVRAVVGNKNITITPLNMTLIKITSFISSVILFEDDKVSEYKNIKLKAPQAVAKLISNSQKLFTGGRWTTDVQNVVNFLFSIEQHKGIATVLRRNYTPRVDDMYRVWINSLKREDIAEVGKLLLGQCKVVKDKNSDNHIAEYASRGLIGGMEYLSNRRSTMGKDKAYGSELSRNIWFCPSFPAAHSTALKWYIAMKDFPDGDYDNIVVAGNNPGHWRKVIEDKVGKYDKIHESEDLWEGTAKRNAVRYIDIIPCTNKDGPQWEEGDVTRLSITNNTVLISDAWADKEKYRFQGKLIASLFGYLIGKGMDDNGKLTKDLEGKLRTYVVKCNIEYEDNKYSNYKDKEIPREYSRLIELIDLQNKNKKENLIDYPYFTKIGRPHNAEIAISSWKLTAESVQITSQGVLTNYMMALGRQMVYANFNRVRYQMSDMVFIPSTDVKLPGDLVPRAAKKVEELVSIDDEILKEIAGLTYTEESVLNSVLDEDDRVQQKEEKESDYDEPEEEKEEVIDFDGSF